MTNREINRVCTIDRESGKDALKTVLNNKNNVEIIEKKVYEMREDDDDNYNLVLYQIIGDILEGKKLKDIVVNLSEDKVGWQNPRFDDMILKQVEQDGFLVKPFEVEEGVLECICGSKRVYSYGKQTRSADEPTTTFAECMNCKNKWIDNG